MMSSNTQTARRSAMNVRTMAQIGMLGAVAMVLMFFEIPLWFAPPFYKIDLSELPVLIGCFAMGPVAGVLIELVKILLYVVVHGTTTAGDVYKRQVYIASVFNEIFVYRINDDEWK